jgi:hypothetical protein
MPGVYIAYPMIKNFAPKEQKNETNGIVFASIHVDVL